MPEEQEKLDHLSDVAAEDLRLHLDHASALDRAAGLVLAFSAALAAFGSDTAASGKGRLVAVGAAVLVLVSVTIRTKLGPDIVRIRDRYHADPLPQLTRTIMDARLAACQTAAAFNRWKAGFLLVGTVTVVVALAWIVIEGV